MYFWAEKKSIMETITQTNVHDVSLLKTIDTIEAEYHDYFKNNLPAIATILSASIKIDKDVIKNLDIIYKRFLEFKALLEQHTSKEKFILFPTIEKLSLEGELNYVVNDLKKVYHKTWDDIYKLSSILKEINSLTNNYEPAATASQLLKQCYMDLRLLEQNCKRYFEIEKKYLKPILN